jgi:hypothetical protein
VANGPLDDARGVVVFPDAKLSSVFHLRRLPSRKFLTRRAAWHPKSAWKRTMRNLAKT